VLFRKELDFAKDFRFHIYTRLLWFAVTVPLALAMRTYWALVIGRLAARVIAVLLSYRMHAVPSKAFPRERKGLPYISNALATIHGIPPLPQASFPIH